MHTVSKDFTFEASHHLDPALLGASHKCCRMHVKRLVRAAIRQSVRRNSPRVCFWLMDFQKKMGWRYEQ